MRHALLVLVGSIVAATAAAQPRGDRPSPPSIRGFEVDNRRCFASFTGPDGALAIPEHGVVSTGGEGLSTLEMEDPSPEGRARLDAWIASRVPRGRRFLVFPTTNERGRRIGWEAVCVALEPIVRPEDVTLGASRPAEPPSVRMLRDLTLASAAIARLDASFAEQVVFVDADGAFLAWWSIAALLVPGELPYLGFDR